MVPDRRVSPRFSSHLRGDETVELWLDPARPLDARLADESMEGLGVLLAERPPLEPGARVTLVHRGLMREAEVRNVVQTAGGQWRVGLRWRRLSG